MKSVSADRSWPILSPNTDQAPASSACSSSGTSLSTNMRIRPSAWRRSANGSRSPVGRGQHHADPVARQAVAGKTGLVVVFDGVGNHLAQAVVERVVAAHRALQF